jgi:replicative DNA helicase
MPKRKKQTTKIKFNLTSLHFEYFIIYASTINPNLITKTKLKLLSDFYELIDASEFEDDEDLVNRYKMLGALIDGRLNKNINDFNKLYMYIMGGGVNDETFTEIHEDIMNEYGTDECDEDDVELIDAMISDYVNYSFIFKHNDILTSLSMKLEQQDYDSLHELCEDYANEISNLNTKFEETKNATNEMYYDFESNDTSSLERVLNKSLSDLKKATHKLKTSVKMKNKMLNGGYEGSRFYLYIGLPGGWKSGELLNLALDFKHYNSLPEYDEDGKALTILYVTQENGIRETIERLWSHYMTNNDDFASHTTEEALKVLQENGFQDGPTLSIKYRPSKSISTADIDNMISDINNHGGRVIAVIQDYMKRIRSTQNLPNLYEELGEVADEFCNMSKKYDIPVISATQFNRSAFSTIEEALKKNKTDPLKELGTSQIGESVKLVDNSDVIISIHKKPNPLTGELMISYNKLKMRGKPAKDDIDYFTHPFEDENSMKLKPDINLAKSLSVIEVGNGLEKFNPKDYRSKRKKKDDDSDTTTTTNPNKLTTSTKKKKTNKGGRLNKASLLDD